MGSTWRRAIEELARTKEEEESRKGLRPRKPEAPAESDGESPDGEEERL